MAGKLRKRLVQKGLETADKLDLPPILTPDIQRNFWARILSRSKIWAFLWHLFPRTVLAWVL